MNIGQLLLSSAEVELPAADEADALVDSRALDEAGLVQCHFDAVYSRLSLVFDCRGALHVRNGEVAVIIIEGVTQWSWSSDNSRSRIWSVVSGWEPRFERDVFSLDVSFDYALQAHMRAVGTGARYLVGRSPNDDLAPPDLTSASDEKVRAGFPYWDTPIELIYGSTLGSL